MQESASIEQDSSEPDWLSLKPAVFSVIALFNYRQDNHPSRATAFLELFHDTSGPVSYIVEALFRLDINSLSISERCMRLSFLTHLFRYLDQPTIQKVLLPLLSLPVWLHLSDAEQANQLQQFPYLRKPLARLRRHASKRDPATKTPLPSLAIFSLVCELESVAVRCFQNPRDELLAVLCEIVSLCAELISQLRLRRTLLPLLSDRRTLTLLQGVTLELVRDVRTASLQWWQSWLLVLEQFSLYFTFPLDPLTGESLPRDSIRASRSKRLLALQRVSYALCRRDSLPPEHILRKVAFGSHREVGNAEFLRSVFTKCDPAILVEMQEALGMGMLAQALGRCFSEKDIEDGSGKPLSQCLVNAIASYCHIENDAIESFRATPVMITEQDLWGPGGASPNRLVAALPSLNIVFLNTHDYLLRNFRLYKGESAWAIREDIEDAVGRLRPSPDNDGIKFGGWAKMAAPLLDIKVKQVGDILLDSDAPEHVKVEIEIDLTSLPSNLRREWFDLQRHDVLFLLKLRRRPERESFEPEEHHVDNTLTGLLPHSVVRGFVVDIAGTQNSDSRENSRKQISSGPKLKLSGYTDNIQYAIDSKGQKERYEEFLKGFNVVVRRRPEINNFFPVLSVIRNLVLSEKQILPDWIEAILLGRPIQAVAESESAGEHKPVDFVDTFVSKEHVMKSFPHVKLRFSESTPDHIGSANSPEGKCHKITFWRKGDQNFGDAAVYLRRCKTLGEVGRFLQRKNDRNTTEFNPVQIQAIYSGLQPGLTLVSGPPGTGKTSCTVQIISSLYDSFPNERTLLITRTNHALNYLVQRLVQRNVDPLRILRLGQGESDLERVGSLSKAGRLNALLRRRLLLLSKVSKLSNSMGQRPSTEADWTCEAAMAFFERVVKSDWEEFRKLKSKAWQDFPFHSFIDDEIREREGRQTQDEPSFQDRDATESFAFISMIFADLKELRFLEILLSSKQRESYLVIKHSRVIAMTCVHAAMQREELLSNQFVYDNLVVEEAAECLEVEALLSLVLQSPGRLKRIVLVGDHKQLPPVVQDTILQQKSNLDQSMFTRLIRTGRRLIQLSHQGRCRSSIGDLFRWRYKDLADMDFISTEKSFLKANPGFRYSAQFIDTGELHSETQPLPHYYQNLAEAEYIAFTFLYMRMIGYECSQIVALTTYKGQVELLRDVIRARSSQFGDYGMPCAISTVDKFQSRQADFVLLSLVRTKGFGHFRDIRRITVAVSRARYGLYVFGYLTLFSSLAEMKNILNLLPTCNDLTLVAGETRDECNRMEADDSEFAEGQIRNVHSPADMESIVSFLRSA